MIDDVQFTRPPRHRCCNRPMIPPHASMPHTRCPYPSDRTHSPRQHIKPMRPRAQHRSERVRHMFAGDPDGCNQRRIGHRHHDRRRPRRHIPRRHNISSSPPSRGPSHALPVFCKPTATNDGSFGTRRLKHVIRLRITNRPIAAQPVNHPTPDRRTTTTTPPHRRTPTPHTRLQPRSAPPTPQPEPTST